MKVGTIATHKKYGDGKVVEDTEGLCKPNEVVFRPDGGMNDRIEIGRGQYAFWEHTAKQDIVDVSELHVIFMPGN